MRFDPYLPEPKSRVERRAQRRAVKRLAEAHIPELQQLYLEEKVNVQRLEEEDKRSGATQDRLAAQAKGKDQVVQIHVVEAPRFCPQCGCTLG